MQFMIAKQEQKYIPGALFISYTGLKDFLKCPRSFYLKNIYRDPKSGYRIQIASAPMTLGSLVHDGIKWYLQTGRNAAKEAVVAKFRNHWLKYRGKKGGFASNKEEGEFGKKGLKMIDNFFENLGVLEENLPAYDFFRYRIDESIVLNGRLDFLGVLPDGSLHVLDFKTGSKDEEDSTQLHTYAIMAESYFQKPVGKISYWYLERDSAPKEAVLDPLEEKLEWLTEKCRQVQEAVKVGEWVCIGGKCQDCKRYEAIIAGEGEFQFSDNDFKKDVYYLPR